MKVLLSPRDIRHLQDAREIITTIYAAAGHGIDTPQESTDLLSCASCIDNVIREYHKTIEGIKGGLI